MDRIELKQRLRRFEALAQERGFPIVLRLDDDVSGWQQGAYVMRIVAPWSAGLSYDNIMDPLLDALWASTDDETRGAIASVRVSATEADSMAFASADGAG